MKQSAWSPRNTVRNFQEKLERVGAPTLKIVGVTLESILNIEAGVTTGTVYAAMAAGMILCAGKTGAFRFLFYRRKNKNTPIVGMIFLRRILSLLSQNRENIALKSMRKIFGETMVFQIARKHKKHHDKTCYQNKKMQRQNPIIQYSLFYWNIGGIFCRLTDFFSYESLWSLPSIATLFGFWIASVSLITYCSSSNRDAFWGSFLYMFGMTVSFYTLKFILGFFWERFSGEFPTALFIAYSVMALVCGIGSYILYFWNKENLFSSLLCALPASGMLAEAIACSIVLWKQKILLGQTLFDFIFAVILGVLLYCKAENRILFFFTLVIATAATFFLIY